MKISIIIARYLMGSIFLLFGLNKFFWFLPMPTPPAEAQAFFGALMATSYFLPFLATTYIVSAALLLTNSFVPLALLLLAGPVLNIQLYHLFLDPADAGLGVVVLLLELFLAYAYRGSFSSVVARTHEPN